MNEMINMLKNVNLSSLKNEKSLDDLIERCKQEGRVEGAIAELRFQLKELNSWKGYKIAFEDGVQNIEKTNFFNQIKNNLKKRLKELEKGGKE